ncbi:MAG: hypothetical protein V7K89_33460 [Nostoc sp.]|uniref:hypothetical protein n=1 Tax=Nostoc sp. TaxID=1180 RepID=UPI002FFC4220
MSQSFLHVGQDLGLIVSTFSPTPKVSPCSTFDIFKSFFTNINLFYRRDRLHRSLWQWRSAHRMLAVDCTS